jgi:DNA primase
VRDVGLVLDRLGVPAKRRGGRWWAERCPLPSHAKQNPAHAWQNFFLRDNDAPRPGQWHCFSCKAGGTLVELVGEVLGIDREAATAWLSSVDEREAPPVLRVRFEASGPTRFRMPAGVEFAPLERWNSVPRRYAESRGITARQVERWGIGYALSGRLDGRIVFPIRNSAGVLSNYAARTFVGDEVRYLAASERERPDKSALFGEEFWGTGERGDVVVFEGAINGLAIERALEGEGIRIAGLQGSQVDHRRLAKLGTFRRVAIATDPDNAGEKVAREISMAIGRRVDVRRVEYPTASDAADTPTNLLRNAVFRCLRA